MGDQRRRSKSRRCQKVHEKGAGRTGRSGRGYSEWVWPLGSIHLRKQKASREREKEMDRKGRCKSKTTDKFKK